MRVLINQEDIIRRIRELGGEIDAYYAGAPVRFLLLLNGAVVFGADLMRAMRTPLTFDTMAVSSYEGRASSGELNFRSAPKLPVAGCRVLLVDDILDSGVTMGRVTRRLYADGAAEVRSCVLLDKEVPRAAGAPARADWHGFRIPPVFAVGYGLDADEHYRELTDICVIE